MAEPSLREVDPEIEDLIEKEKWRQWSGIELIASENFTSGAVLECLGSVLTNKYSEGLPYARYYGGNEYIDAIESLCQKRALAAFGLNDEEWGVNVQSLSGSPANLQVYTALLQPHDRLMGLALAQGGHLTHGFFTKKKRVSASAIFFESMQYELDPATGLIDYDTLQKNALLFVPKLLICGGSAYSRDYDYPRLRAIADSVGAYLMADIAHFSGLVSAGLLASPFEYADVVTTTTHKTLRGPRGALIFFKKPLADKINSAVFPAHQGGPHNNVIAGIAVQLKEMVTEEYKDYSRRVVANSRTLAAELLGLGYTLISGGTDNHLFLWDLKPQKLNGAKLQWLCDAVKITLNKNSIPSDTSVIVPGGVRIGTPAMTSRGVNEDGFRVIAQLLHRTVQLAVAMSKQSGPKLENFKLLVSQGSAEITALRQEVFEFASALPLPGVDVSALRYREVQLEES
jgi:glycine hydroxymethyltransferase